MDTSDRTLLDRYTASQDEAAFRTLVERHLPLVHAVARRVTSNDELARDVTQQVFIRLAERTALIPRELSLPGWLHRVCRHLAIDAVRSEERRHRREQAHTIPSPAVNDEPVWTAIAPLLDELVERLPTADREVLLLRYYRNEPHAIVARHLGLTEAVAKKRASRALEKLRTLLARRGIVTSAVALSSLLPAHACPPVAGSLAATVLLGSRGCVPVPANTIHAVVSGTNTAQKLGLTAAAMFFAGSMGWSLRPDIRAASVTAMPPPLRLSANADDGRSIVKPTVPLTAEARLARLQEILAIPGYVDRSSQMLDFANSLSGSQIEELTRHLNPEGGQPHREEFAALVSAWARLDPQSACEFIISQGNDSTLHGLPVSVWAVKDPTAAMAWAKQFPDAGDPISRSFTATSVLSTVARNDPASACRMIGMLGWKSEDSLSIFAENLAGQVPRLPERLDETLAAIDDPLCRRAFLKAAAAQTAGSNPTAALEMLSAHPDIQPEVGVWEICNSITAVGFDDTVTALHKLPDGPRLATAVNEVIRSADDPHQAFALLEEFPEVATDESYVRALSAIAGKDPAYGAERIDHIRDEKVREGAFVEYLHNWMKQEPQTAWSWLDTHQVPDAVRSHFESP